VALFDWVEGTTIAQSASTAPDQDQAADLIARLHASVRCAALPSLPREGFELWFVDWLQRVLAAASGDEPLEGACERQARALLARARKEILAALDRLERRAARVRNLAWEPAITHGDLQPENWIVDRDGRLHLIDWSKVTIAPPERDLIYFSGERFELFLAQYARAYGRCPRLHPELFAYYRLFLTLWGIADYGSWILLEDAEPAEKEHAWQALCRYLPIDRERLQAEVDRIDRAIQRIRGAP
jgi:thiamine kinase-like enzyme